MTGLFFCLASANGAGLLFCPAAIQSHTSVYSEFCAVHATIPPTSQNSTQGFTGDFPVICPILPPTIPDRHKRLQYRLRHVGTYHSVAAHPAYTRYQRHAGRCTGQHSRPIIIRYIRTQRCAPVIDPCQTVQHIADHASPAGSRCFQRLALAWHQVSLALAWHCAFFLARRRETLDGYRRISFRAFAR